LRHVLGPLAQGGDENRHDIEPIEQILAGGSLEALRASGDFAGWIEAARAAAPGAELIYLAHEIVTAADNAGVDLIDLVHTAGRRVDAYTIQQVTPASLALVRRLVALRADQITTDDAERLYAEMTT
jgi:glycerophosphoryl diester phosphodiesterase